MKLIHLSDIHLTIPGEPMAGLDPYARLDLALAHINNHHADAARVIITGDLTHWGEPEAYAGLKDAVSGLSIDVRLLMGNHDNRANLLAAFPDLPQDVSGHVNYAETVDGCRLIYLDTTAPRTHAGHFDANSCAWLDAELREATHARIFMHHNPMPLGLPAVDKIALVSKDRSGFKAVIEAHRSKIGHIHFGHVHMATHGTYAGVPFASVPSTCMQSIPDMAETDLLKGAALPPAYHVINTQGTDTTILPNPFAWDGPVNSTGTAWEDWAKPVAAQ